MLWMSWGVDQGFGFIGWFREGRGWFQVFGFEWEFWGQGWVWSRSGEY